MAGRLQNENFHLFSAGKDPSLVGIAGSGSLLRLCLVGQARVCPSPENRLSLLKNSCKRRLLPDPRGRACFSREAGMATTAARPAGSWIGFPI